MTQRIKEIEGITNNITGQVQGLDETIRELNTTLQDQLRMKNNSNDQLIHLEELGQSIEQQITNLVNKHGNEPDQRTDPQEPPNPPSRSWSPSPDPFQQRLFQRESAVQPTTRFGKQKESVPEPERPSFLNQTTTAGTMIPNEAQTKKPDPFNGKKGKEAEIFFMEMEIYFNDYEEGTFDYQRKITNVLMNMASSDATNWAQPFLHKLSSNVKHPTLKSWTTFKKSFLEDFSDPVKKDKAIRELSKITQTKSAQVYVTQFRTLQQEVDWDEEALMDRFKEGLKPEVRKELLQIAMLMEEEKLGLGALYKVACKFDDMIYANQKLNQPNTGSVTGWSTVGYLELKQCSWLVLQQ
ncbi:Transposon Tf2-1 polyprotein [Ceratobasidium sp. AG-Ba]|nr:Transposon Tf2-1 polyprotein [Ceratobasidium sp. AG-Ba]QRV99494.1 Transposon Tf2-1 polyprotein [Ceratobasidium sp. AG-Ba]QRW14004.1 Transposon Tf2-1 polyprotein [Ceratobasidium sp. AG-Ba]